MLKLKIGKQYKHRDTGILVQIKAIENGQHQNLIIHFAKPEWHKNMILSAEDFRNSFSSKGAEHA